MRRFLMSLSLAGMLATSALAAGTVVNGTLPCNCYCVKMFGYQVCICICPTALEQL